MRVRFTLGVTNELVVEKVETTRSKPKAKPVRNWVALSAVEAQSVLRGSAALQRDMVRWQAKLASDNKPTASELRQKVYNV